MRVHEPPLGVLVRQKLSGLWQYLAHLQSETTAYVSAPLAARLNTCWPWPGIVILAQEWPPLTVRNR
jgi:hypothetical protein